MPESPRRLILANGEKYEVTVERPRGGRRPEPPRPYEAARALVRSEITSALGNLSALPARMKYPDEVVMCLRLHPDRTAKSYDPNGLFGLVPDLENVGSRNYRIAAAEVAQTRRIKKLVESHLQETTGRMVFVRSSDSGFQRFLQVLNRPEQQLQQAFREDIQSIERFNLLTPGEQLLGFSPDWREGRVELVLHPSRHSESEQKNFLRKLFHGDSPAPARTRFASYPEGPLFVSCYLSREKLAEMAGANPLRTAHPLVMSALENLRGSPMFPAPPPPTSTTRSTIAVGIFDGGVDLTVPSLLGRVEEDNALSIQTPKDDDCVAHGTAVAGAVLYGPLNDFATSTPLSEPPVSVVSVRALPTTDPSDVDLYECIDIVENAVPARPDIKIWNLSFGPQGPIADDTISRFTYALDTLAAAHKVCFCVAVGNDGEAGPDLGRVQSPSDLVNGLGIGAFTRRPTDAIHAPYSCQGPGRECAKIKPDLVAFGGCDQTPTQMISTVHGKKVFTHGTSFSAPLVASLGGQALGLIERGTALLARALLIHTALHPAGAPDELFGHGLVVPKIDDILRCGEREVTIIFQGELIATRQVKLPVMLPTAVVSSGRVSVKWTVAGLPPVSPNHPADYTNLCINDTFYPNSQVFSFAKKNSKGGLKTKRVHIKQEEETAKQLHADGWKKSKFPVSESGNAYRTEDESRRLDYKWEPIVRHEISKNATSFHDPFLVLHAIPRHGASGRLDYAAVVTISAPKFDGDLYSETLRRFTALQPVRLRTEAQIRVQI